ncbi:MAG TPA: hypothetical protein VN841_28040 [Bryobacteraceae bacterium]|nr:hypothetical protein [Bryobacteraceae bacterium]
MKQVLWAFCFCAAAVLAQPDTCASVESRVDVDVQRVRVAENQLGAFRGVGDQALSALRQCPESARLWYLAARSAEILEGPMDGQAFTANGGLKKIVADALAHAPSSAPVVTVAARVQGSSSLARKAVALDPNYQPAQRALAELLAKEGAFEEALRYASAQTPSGPMRLTRARVLLAAKRPAEAVEEVRKVAVPGEPDELAPSVEMYRDAQEVLGFALLDLRKTAEGRKALEAAAAAGSMAAQRYLAK